MIDKILEMGFEKLNITTWKPLKKTEDLIHYVEIYHPAMGVFAKGKLALQFPFIDNKFPTLSTAVLLKITTMMKEEIDKLPADANDSVVGKTKAVITNKLRGIVKAHIEAIHNKEKLEKEKAKAKPAAKKQSAKPAPPPAKKKVIAKKKAAKPAAKNKSKKV